ncbi:glycoside hydrolase [Triangularia verruculosa]|uniref:alpha-1,2-Mannosidase n=1 Tax=Triangularia verruculosa TaxID=2587418 RepID=A0AAN6XJI4_9PEZI|nr:glycoside hydrolase [Triangularia verruculosa]
MAILTARRFQRLALLTVVVLIFYILFDQGDYVAIPHTTKTGQYVHSTFDWAKRRMRYPFDESKLVKLPEGKPRELPRVQYDFSQDDASESHIKTQKERQAAVKEAAQKSWDAYRKYAWGRDELLPEKLVGKDTFAGWGATLVDSLDTLWIMGMKDEYKEAVQKTGTINWDKTNSPHCSLFETTIRYLGGLLSAYDLSGDRILLEKAIELGDMLYAGFDTPNHMPANSFNFREAKEGRLRPSMAESSAAAGTLSLEFTRLTQLTSDPKYYNAIAGVTRALEKTQDDTKLPGMWPVFIDVSGNDPEDPIRTSGTSFSLGASADSAYEYFSKMYALLGGLDPTYKKLHLKSMATARKHLLFRPMLPDLYPATPPDVLLSGNVYANGQDIIDLQPQVQHLGCFSGGMFALGGKLFHEPAHVKIGEQLARGCAWAYETFPSGIMPEVAEIIPCPTPSAAHSPSKDEKEEEFPQCKWDDTVYKQAATTPGRYPKPFRAVQDPSYLLRPEAIESVFIAYRITGKKDLLDIAWRMFTSVKKATETKEAYTAISDVNADPDAEEVDAHGRGVRRSRTKNSMESFWIAETLKYFYLIFSEPDLISLDDYVFNTEAHPLRIPKPGRGTGGKDGLDMEKEA